MSTNRPELVICRGLQASGKTTWAHTWVGEDRKNRARVNRDDLRTMIDKGIYVEGVTEGRILVARNATVNSLLRRGISVVSDDTNLSSKNVRDLAKIAVHGGYDWRVQDFTTVPLDTCLARNHLRNEIVNGPTLEQHVVIDTYNRFLKNKCRPLPLPDMDQLAQGAAEGIGKMYVPDPKLPKAIIVDVDGTVALRGTRSPFDESRVYEDAPNSMVIDAICNEIDRGAYPIFCSGRTSACRQATVEWLTLHIPYIELWGYGLFMRAEGDRRPDFEIKLELFDQHIRPNYNVLRVYDDRKQVVDMWRSIGLTVLQVAEGNF